MDNADLEVSTMDFHQSTQSSLEAFKEANAAFERHIQAVLDDRMAAVKVRNQARPSCRMER